MLKIAFNSIYKHPLKVGHRFPMEKYELLPQVLGDAINFKGYIEQKLA